MNIDIAPKIDPLVLKKYNEKYKDEFFIQEMDMIKYMPTFRCISNQTFNNGKKIYYLRSDSEKTLFINSLYYALYNFMLYLGFDPENPFLYANPNHLRKKSKRYSIFEEKVYDRLITYSKVIKYGENSRKFTFVRANFFSNDIEKDLGFYIRCCSRTVDIVTFPNVSLKDHNGKEISPELFFHLLLLNMKYPKYVYYYNKINGTLNRVVREYPHLINKTHRYKKWSF